MAHMRVFASRFAAYNVDTDNGTEIVPVDVCGELDESSPTFHPNGKVVRDTEANVARLRDYVTGKVYGIERREGWYARLSAPGYLDCTEWQGPEKTKSAAVAEVCEQYDCDENGDDPSEEGDVDTEATEGDVGESGARDGSGAWLLRLGAE